MFEDRVIKGAAVLDASAPRLWREMIDLNTLDLSDGEDCVLGQVFGTYVDGLTALELPEDEAEEHGFYLACTRSSDDSECECGRDYPALTQAWLDYLNA